MRTDIVAERAKKLLGVLSDGKPHESGELKCAIGLVGSVELARALERLRENGHNVIKTKDIRCWKRKARIVEYTLQK